MSRIHARAAWLAAIGLGLLATPAHAVFVCTVDGAISYQQTPCPRPSGPPTEAIAEIEPSAETEPSAEKEPSAEIEPSAEEEPSAAEESASAVKPAAPIPGTDPEPVDAAHLIPLRAIADNDIVAVATALDNGAHLDGLYPTNTAAGADAGTALAMSLDLAARDVFELLLTRGADVSVAVSARWTPLFQAAALGDVNVLEKLLRHGQWGAPTVRSAAATAAANGHADARDFLVAAAGGD